MSEEVKKCMFCKKDKAGDSLNDRQLKNGEFICPFCIDKLDEMKDCIRCWLVNDINKDKKQLAEEKARHQTEKNNFPSYENSEKCKQQEKDIKWLETAINSREKQLPELTCQKNVLCGEDSRVGVGMEFCEKCYKYLSLNIGYKGDNWKSQDYYTHRQNCQVNNNHTPNRERERRFWTTSNNIISNPLL